MRQSIAPTRQSQLPNSGPHLASSTKLLEKKKEFEAALALEKASTQLLKRVEGLADDFDNISDAGIVYGHVLEQWPYMFRILGIFLSTREQASKTEGGELEGDRLVRIPIEELQNEEQAT